MNVSSSTGARNEPMQMGQPGQLEKKPSAKLLFSPPPLAAQTSMRLSRRIRFVSAEDARAMPRSTQICLFLFSAVVFLGVGIPLMLYPSKEAGMAPGAIFTAFGGISLLCGASSLCDKPRRPKESEIPLMEATV